MFGIEIETCAQCGGKVRVLASIEDPTVIGRILGHLASRELPAATAAGLAGILGWQTHSMGCLKCLFPPEVTMTQEFDVVVERDAEGFFVASIPALPGCHTQVRSLDELMVRVKEAIELCLDVQGAPCRGSISSACSALRSGRDLLPGSQGQGPRRCLLRDIKLSTQQLQELL